MEQPQPAMSDDYAALTVSLMSAVLVIATVQAQHLFRKYMKVRGEVRLRLLDAEQRIAERLAAGENPTADEVSELANARALLKREESPLSSGRFLYAFYGVSWLTLCVLIFTSIRDAVYWSGTADHGPDPNLAARLYYVTEFSVGSLLVSVSFVAVSKYLTGEYGWRKGRNAFSDSHDRMDELLAERSAAQQNHRDDDQSGAPNPTV